MTAEIENILNVFAKKMSELYGDDLVKVVLYGSYARGDNRENSDIDIMVLVRASDDVIKEKMNEIYDFAFDIEMDTGIDISPVVKNEEQYNYWMDTLPYYKNIQNEGVLLYAGW